MPRTPNSSRLESGGEYTEISQCEELHLLSVNTEWDVDKVRQLPGTAVIYYQTGLSDEQGMPFLSSWLLSHLWSPQ